MTLTQITKVKGPGIHTLANIVSNTISLGGIATASNFKTGTSNLHNVGLEIAGINVLGADTPIGTGATIYDAGGAVFTGVVTATKFVGQADISGGSIVATTGTFSGSVSIGGTLTYEDVTNIDSVGLITARSGLISPNADIDDFVSVGSNIHLGNAGVVTATSFSGSGASLTALNGSNISSGTVAAARIDNLAASKITSGTVATARLGSGTASSSTFLRGDGSWAATGAGTGEQFVNLESLGSASNTGNNTFAGYNSGIALSGADHSTFFGYQAGKAALNAGNNCFFGSNSGLLATGGDNSGFGQGTLETITSATSNVAVGRRALNTTTSSENVAIGADSLRYQSTGSKNVAVGRGAGEHLTSAGDSVAIGFEALRGTNTSNPVTGLQNVAIGAYCGDAMKDGSQNVLIGTNCGTAMVSSHWNVAIGKDCADQATGLGNVILGHDAGRATSGNYNVVLGKAAGDVGSFSGANNIIIGYNADPTTASTSNEITLGNANITNFRVPGIGLTVTNLQAQYSGGLTVSGISTFSEVVKFDANVSSTPSAAGNVHIYRHDNKLKVCGGSGIQFEEGGFTRWHITNGALHPHGTTYNNLGNTSNLVGHAYFGDNKKIQLGNDQDFTLWHNNSHGLIKNTTGRLYVLSDDLWIKNEADNKTSARFMDGGEVFLYNNDTLRLTTTTTGITVGGEVAAAQDYPNIRPTLDFNFVAVKKLDPRIRYQRSGPASYVDENGLVKLVGDNTPRFDHDPSTRECKGLLMEESRTSRLTQSTHNKSFSGFRQYNQGETIKGPDGVENSAREYTVNSNGGTGGTTTIWANEAIGMASGVSVSCFLKITRGTTMAFRFMDNNNAQESEKITISGGYITDGSYATVSQSDPGSTEGTTSYERYPNGWVKIKWYGASNNANATSYLQLYIYDHAAANSDGDNIGYAVWGFQVENGAFCTSTILKPTTEAVIRGADNAFIDGQDFTDAYNVPEGTFILNASNDDFSTSNQGTWGVEKSTNRSGFFAMLGYRVGGGSNAGDIGAWYNNNGSTSAFHNMAVASTGVTVGVPYKTAFAYKVNDMSSTTNGITVQTDTSATIAAAGEYDRFSLGSYHYDSMSVGHIQRVMYYRKRLPSSQLVTLTS